MCWIGTAAADITDVTVTIQKETFCLFVFILITKQFPKVGGANEHMKCLFVC